MPTIRIHEWTKEKLQQVREAESHSSYDSVVKTLLRDRKVAQLSERLSTEELTPHPEEPERSDKEFSDLTALAEITSAREGIMFLWCPNCGNEVAHIVAETTVAMSVFEIQCQQCLTELNQHAIVAVEIGYPVELKVVENDLQSDLQTCIIDYWDRLLRDIGDDSLDDKKDAEYLIWQIIRYYQSFDWDWPMEYPTVGLKPGETYLNRSTEEYIAVVEEATDENQDYGPYHVESWPADADRAAATEQVLDSDQIRHLLTTRVLYLAPD